MRKILISAAIILTTFSSCGVYNKYQSTSTAPEKVFGEGQEVRALEKNSIAQLPWRTFFTDAKLQALIDTALVRNTNLQIAQLNVEMAEASLHASKMAYIPAISLTPQGSVNRAFGVNFNKYTLSASAEYNIGNFFGGITNRKRQAQAVRDRAIDEQTALITSIVADVATGYHQLQILDQQLDILTKTVSLWEKSLDTQRALMENGKAYSTSVDQMEASLLNIRTQRIDVINNIKDIENAICLLLAQTPHSIDRNAGSTFELPKEVGIGLPVELLHNRADVRVAEHAIENAFYVTQEARSMFYPQLTLSGTMGWSNGDAGNINPAQWIMSAIGQLTQPIFAQGKLNANLKISKLQQEQAQKMFANTVLRAGNEVNEYLADCQAAHEKAVIYAQQVKVLQKAYDGTHELMNNGKATYLEVLTAQESLLNAQLSEAANLFNGNQALINLYIALGGGAQ